MTGPDGRLLPPAGYYRTVEEWFSACQSNGNPTEGNKLDFFSEHDSQFSTPKGLDEAFTPREYHQRLHHSAFVAVIPGGRLWGPRGAVITPDNKLLWDVSLEFWESSPEQHSVFQQAGLPPVEHCSETLGVLTYTASDSYFHWMLDVLPRIALLRKTGIAIDKFVFNTNYNPPPSFHTETLDMLGIPPGARLTIGTVNVHLQAKLLVSSLVGYHSNYPRWAVDFLRDAFSKYSGAGDANEYKRLYISREDANYRKITNEDQVMDLLGKYRFQKVVLSKLSVEQQIRIFSSAEIIIAPHGANLTNLVFCKRGTKVIEIFSPYYINTIYWIMSNHAGLDYYYFIGNKMQPSKSLFEYNKVREVSRAAQGIEVDIDRLRSMMKRTGMDI
ncbi:glycosyltransferase family 61 protein [Paenibacillus naphthalenovorans]|uniref:glycosyltransferase family 61 protein n=1 Tax=Paenibacillus naphthalenovorans TaxID=162209 RepID=UPI0010B0538F|nr:glycosyltransferase family 61 protein [Paenibacillus naphthalenovorans]GCL73799.1 glycosyltransferase family 61 protein [Paenibacillus naphthalenovorans]